MKLDKDLIDGATNYLVYDIEDLGTSRNFVNAHHSLQAAIEEADIRGGFVVSADWRGLSGVEHIAATVRPEEIAQQVIEGKPTEGGLRCAHSMLATIQADIDFAEGRSPHWQQVAQIMQTVRDNAIAYHRYQVTDQRGRPFSFISERELSHAVVPSCYEGEISWHEDLAAAEKMAARYANHGDDHVYLVPLAKKAKAQLFKLAA